jgi:outer membrane protein
MKKVIVTTLFFACIASFAAPALTLKDAVELALKNQSGILKAERDLAGAKYGLTKENSAYFPNLSIGYSQGVINADKGKAVGNSSLTAGINIYDGGQRDLNVKKSKLGVDSSNSTLEKSKQGVINTVTGAYFELLSAKKLNEVKKLNMKLLTGQLDLIKARVEVGDAAAVDTLPVEVKVANARVGLLSSNNSIKKSAIQLQNAIGIPITTNFDIEDFPPQQITIDTLDNYINIAKSNRPEILISKAVVETAKVNINIKKFNNQIIPTVNGSWDCTLVGKEKSSYKITAGVTYSIFDGGANKADINAAKTSLESAIIGQKQTDKDIQLQVQTAYIDVIDAIELIKYSDLSVKSAQTSYDAQEEKYKLGLGTTLDLLNAQNDLVTAQSNAVTANYDYYINIGKLEYATGKQGVLYGN